MTPIQAQNFHAFSHQLPAYTAHSPRQTFGWLANEKNRELMKDIYSRSENIPYKKLEHIQKGVCYTQTMDREGFGQVIGFIENGFNWCGQMIQKYVVRNPEKPLTFELKTFNDVASAIEYETKGLSVAKRVKTPSFIDLVYRKNEIKHGEKPVMINVQECLRDKNHVLVVKGRVDGRDAMEIAETMNNAIEAVGPRGNVMDQDLV